MDGRRVAILYTHPLLGEGIARLLEGEEGTQVILVDGQTADAREQVRLIGADAVVVEVDPKHEDLLRLLRESGAGLVVCVTLGDNGVDLYRTWHLTVTRVEDLRRVIRIGEYDDTIQRHRAPRRPASAMAGREEPGRAHPEEGA